ncbi:MAG: glycosyltransferase family 2 protein [Gemmatimonadetes bacterium]|nr:glycosyltransferase family 2 protein [Gemmatimonadota bacterium]
MSALARPKISVTIITKNEEAEIRECIESVAWADEIIVVDSFSTDRTVEIANEMGALVEQRTFTGFTDQKQHASDNAAGPWILNIDADERVTPELRAEIEGALAKSHAPNGDPGNAAPSNGDPAGYTIPRRTWYAGAFVKHAWWPDRKLRLFLKERGRWTGGSVHEGMAVDGPVAELQSPLVHYSFRTLTDHLRTINNLTEHGADDLVRAGAGRSIWNLIIRPPSTFIKMYFIRRGILDGWRGLVIAFLSAAHTTLKYAKARQRHDEADETRS